MRCTNRTHLLVTFRGSSVLGEVITADDGASLTVRFTGKLGPYCQVIHLVWVGDGYTELLEGRYVGLVYLMKVAACGDLPHTQLWTHRQVSSERLPVASWNGEPA